MGRSAMNKGSCSGAWVRGGPTRGRVTSPLPGGQNYRREAEPGSIRKLLEQRTNSSGRPGQDRLASAIRRSSSPAGGPGAKTPQRRLSPA